MNLLDLLLVTMAISAAVVGYQLGLVARLISWLGFTGGLAVGVLVLPRLIERLEDASQPSKVLVAVATLLGAALIGQGLALTVGSKLHIEVPEGPARHVDKAGGAVAGIFGVLVPLWLLVPVLSAQRGWLAEQTYGSAITREVHDLFPEPPDTMTALRRIVGDEVFPLVFGGLQRAPDLGPPPAASGLTEEVADRVVTSTVKVTGVACQRVQEGSGFVAEPGLVVTNAHVVAGEDETEVELADGSVRDATVVAYDPGRDVAVLRVDDLTAPPLPLRDAEIGDVGGVFGHPGGGPLEVSPFQVAEEIRAVGRDVYDRQRSERQVLVLAADLAPGDSGAALVDPQGQVVGLAFAVAPDKGGVAYALALEEVRDVLAGDLSSRVGTGDCLV
ncbi:MAG TPA: MarP family serine protease [Acidimicrobiales bacterium]